MNLFYIESLSPLYEDVQRSGIFEDSKFFPDCTPKHTTKEILQLYVQQKSLPDFDLKTFVAAHFTFPETPSTDYKSEGRDIEDHIHELWGHLTRQADTDQGGTLIPLPHPYIVPGGRFREVYYWDSYFTMLGLRISEQTELMRNIVNNFAHLLNTIGFIPNGNRTYYMGRSQPPFMAMMIEVLCNGNTHKMTAFRTSLEKEYAFWMDGVDKLTEENPVHRRVVRLPNGQIMNRYWDDKASPRPEAWKEDVELAEKSGRPAEEVWRHIRAAAESGWDFSSRWCKDGQNLTTIQTADLLPVDLNCLMFNLEQTLQRLYAWEENFPLESEYSLKADARKTAILSTFWDEENEFYFDYNFVEHARTKQFTLAALFPMFYEMTPLRHAPKLAARIENSFLKPGGLLTTLTNSGQQWDAPNGWAPLQWIAFMAFRSYGMVELSDKIRAHWLPLNEKVYAATGKMMEKYNVEDMEVKAGGGEYPNQDGFGWTNGVYLAMKEE